MHEHLPITLLRKAEIPKAKHKQLLKNLEGLSNDHEDFWIIDGNLAATVEDLLLMCHQLQPDAVYIDGAYLMRSSQDTRMARWERIGTVLEYAKQKISTELDIPLICSYQFNKEGAKSKDLENIGGTDIIGQIASVVLALYKKEEDEGTFGARKKIDIIKGRHGEQGEFFIRWLFDIPPFMKFNEIEAEPQEGDESGAPADIYM